MASTSAVKSFALAEGEAELGRSDSVLKKQAGHAIVTTKRLVWTPMGSSEAKYLALPYSIIRRHMASVAGSQHCLLKVITEVSGKEQAIVFLFEGDTKEANRDKIRDLLTSALAAQPGAAPPASSTTSTSSSARAKEKPTAPVRVKSEPTETTSDLPQSAPKRRKLNEDTSAIAAEGALSDQPAAPALSGTRKLLYEQDADLREVYNQVVLTKIISDEEFWASRQALIKETERKLKGHADGDARQRRGISSELANEIQPVKQEGGSVHFRLTPAVIHQIFVEHPAVHRAFKEYVPQKMSEKEFWTKFLQSQYFKKQQQANTDKNTKKDKEKEKDKTADDDMFSRLTMSARDEQRELEQQIAAIDPTLNLAKEGAEEIKDDDEIDYIEGDTENAQTARALVRRERERRKKSQQLIKKFNRHGQLVLDSFSKFDRDEDDNEVVVLQTAARPVRDNDDEETRPQPSRLSYDEETLQSRRHLLEDRTALRDLEEDVTVLYSTDAAPRGASFVAPFLVKDEPDEINPSERKARAKRILDELASWQPGPILESTINFAPSLADKVAKELFPASSLRAREISRDDSGIIVLDATLEDEVLLQLKGQLRTVNELLQHFWNGIQSSKPDSSSKLPRIADALRKHQVRMEETLFNFKSVDAIAAAITVSLEPIERALKTLRLTENPPKKAK